MSKIELSRSAYLHNLKQIYKKIGDKDKIIVVLKDNAYGHGATLIAEMANEFGISRACTRSIDEAILLTPFFKDIIVLSHIANGSENDKFTYVINELDALKAIKSGVKAHLGIDTMMHRNGLEISQIKEAFKIAKKRNIMLNGACTHFRSSDELSGEYFVQKEKFAVAKKDLKKIFFDFGVENPLFHSHNSAAVERASEFDGECIRVGMAQFGYAGFDESLDLKKVLKLYANRVSKRTLKAGSCVGYGGTFKVTEDMSIATYDLGYADGLFRFNGKGDLFLANGAKILGKTSMDSFSSADLGDEICVIEDARVWAEFFSTISYEILTKLNPNIKRVVVK